MIWSKSATGSRGTLSDREEQWHQYESIESLPETPLDGWEELVVYTDEQCFGWSKPAINRDQLEFRAHPVAQSEVN